MIQLWRRLFGSYRKILRTLFAIISDFSIKREVDFDERALAHGFTFYLYILYTPFPSYVLLNHPLSPGAHFRCFLHGAFLLFWTSPLAWPRVSSQRYVENVELVRELFLSRKRSSVEREWKEWTENVKQIYCVFVIQNSVILLLLYFFLWKILISNNNYWVSKRVNLRICVSHCVHMM